MRNRYRHASQRARAIRRGRTGVGIDSDVQGGRTADPRPGCDEALRRRGRRKCLGDQAGREWRNDRRSHIGQNAPRQVLQDLAFEAVVIERVGRASGNVGEVDVVMPSIVRMARGLVAVVVLMRFNQVMQFVLEYLEGQRCTGQQ